MGQVQLNSEITHFLIPQGIRDVYKNVGIFNNTNIITIISRYSHILILTLFAFIEGIMGLIQKCRN